MTSVLILDVVKLVRKHIFQDIGESVKTLDVGKHFRKLFFQDIGDKRIEVVGLENCLHMGQVGDNACLDDG